MRVCFLNPFGTPMYDGLIADALRPALRPDVELVVRHLDAGPANIDYYAPKHLVEVEIMRAARQAEKDGFDAFVIGCCYDPALTQVREMLKIPVVGPLEASVGFARTFGHRFAIVTDHHKAVPELRDRVRLYGQEANCTDVRAVGWFIDDMILDHESVAQDAWEECTKVMAETSAETVIIGCTIVSACYEKYAASTTDPRFAELSVINPNVLAMKQAEVLVDLAAAGLYRISRAGYYQSIAAHDTTQAVELDAILDGHT